MWLGHSEECVWTIAMEHPAMRRKLRGHHQANVTGRGPVPHADNCSAAEDHLDALGQPVHVHSDGFEYVVRRAER